MSDLKLGKVDLSAVANCERDGGVPLHAAVQTSVCAVCSPASALISATTIFAPSAAIARAVARPMPVPRQ